MIYQWEEEAHLIYFKVLKMAQNLLMVSRVNKILFNPNKLHKLQKPNGLETKEESFWKIQLPVCKLILESIPLKIL